MNKLSTLTLIASLITSTVLSATNFVSITDLGSSARSIALGNVDGYSNSADAVFSNPAALTNVHGLSVSLFSATLMNEVSYFNAALSAKTAHGTIAVGIYEQSVSNIASTDIAGNYNKAIQTGSYDFKNSVVKLSYQEDLSAKLSVAASYSLYTQSVAAYSATGSNIDAGILASFNRFKLSVYAQNILLNQTVNFSHNAAETLPFAISTTAIVPFKSFVFIPQLKITRGQALLSTGLSFTPGFLPSLTVNAGYNEKLDYIAQKHANLTLGASLSLLQLDLHVAYERSEHIEMDHNMYASFSYSL